MIRELDQEHYAPAAQTVAELRDFWVSQPVLYDPKWGERDLRNGGTALEMIRAESFGLAKQCDDFVKHVDAGGRYVTNVDLAMSICIATTRRPKE